MCESCGCTLPHEDHHQQSPAEKKLVDIHTSLLAANNEQAAKNRHHFEQFGAVAINLISSPGSGKTTLLEHTIEQLGDEFRIGVIEGDIETERDADRIRSKGIPVVQLTTGGACHLDARLVHKGFHRLVEESGAENFDILFIENVGNLVCPATFDLGEHKRVVLVSVPEGSDKPAKYPSAFYNSQLFMITKTDLLPHFDFSVDEARREALRLNPDLDIMEIAAPKKTGLEQWLQYLRTLVTVGSK
jgi:hydrogenase nickel incorporation protein HypB